MRTDLCVASTLRTPVRSDRQRDRLGERDIEKRTDVGNRTSRFGTNEADVVRPGAPFEHSGEGPEPVKFGRVEYRDTTKPQVSTTA